MTMAAKKRSLRSVAARRRVLVVDDDSETRSILSAYLDGLGYDSRFVTSGDRALALLRTQPLPDAVVCGEWASGLSGPEFIRRLRANPTTTVLPVLRMEPDRTSSEGSIDGADAAGANPVRLLELGDRLVRLE
jgi:CheY-like chemotaxis protein